MNATESAIRTSILAVDDRPQNLVALEAILEPLGQDVVKAHSGEEALKHLLKSDFAVILLDVQMPGLDGFETARLIKEREKSRHIPIIFLTAISKDENFVFKGYTVGAVDYISKPFDPDILRSKVSVFVDLYRKNEQIRQQAEALRLSQEREREREVAELKRAGERRYKQLAESMPQMVSTAQLDGTHVYFNQRWFDYTGLTPDESLARGWAASIHSDDLAACDEQWRRAVETGQNFETMCRFRRIDSAYRWHLLRGIPLRDERGAIASWIVTYTDIDDRKRAEEALRLLAEASTLLSASLDYHATLQSVAQLAVPAFADLVTVSVVEESGEVRPYAVVHHDARRVAELELFAEQFPFGHESTDFLSRVLRTGESVVLPDSDEVALSSIAGSPEQLEALERLGVCALISTPLVARGRALGAVTLAMSDSGRTYSAPDLSLAEDLARRASAAIDNARLYQIAERERERLEEANRAKDEFLAVVSHELRTPLNDMLGWTQLLRTGRLDEALFHRAVDTIERNAKSQAQLIGDLLDVSRIITGKLQLKIRRVEIENVLRAAIDSVRPALTAKNVDLSVAVDPDVAPIAGDPDRLQQVVWNLLSNAIKFTGGNGRIELTARCEDGAVAIAVKDTGAGIRPDFLPYVFDRFRQADSSSTRAAGGLGLGLSIVKHLVELHGGSVAAWSKGEGEGAVFTVRIPFVEPPAVDEEPNERDSTPSGEHAMLRGLRIVIVEDEEDGKEALRLMLERLGATTFAVDSAADALDLLDREVPDVLLSDIGLPGESGYDLIAKIRRLDADSGGRVPAIALTAYASQSDRERALEAGFDDHLAKPIDPGRLIAAIRDLVVEKQSASGSSDC